MSEERLKSFLNKNIQNWYSKGVYDYENIHFHNIKNNALFIVQKDGKEINRYQYVPIDKKSILIKNQNGKSTTITYTIRKNTYSDNHHFSSKYLSILFNNKVELDDYLIEQLGNDSN